MGEMTKKPTVPAIRFKGFTDTWEQCELGAIIQAVQELTSDFENYPLYSLTIENGVTPKTERYERSFLITKETDLFKIVPEQCFVSNPMNLRFGAIGFNDSGKKVSVSGYYDVFSIDRGECSNFWCVYLKTANSLKRFDDVAIGSLIEKRRVHFSQLTEMSFPAPNMNEKKKLGEFFERLERLITLHQRKLDKLHKVKRSLLERMFPRNGANVPEIRFSGFTDAWEQRKFSDFTFAAGERNKDDLDLEPFAITNNQGFIAQSEAHDDFGYMKDVDRKMYIVVKPNSFAYNPARINVGSLGYYEGAENVIVSSLYEVFQTAEYVDDKFLKHWFKTKAFQDWIERLQEGSVRLYFYYDKLCECIMSMPSVEEQRKIGAYLDKIDNLITLHQRKSTLSIIA